VLVNCPSRSRAARRPDRRRAPRAYFNSRFESRIRPALIAASCAPGRAIAFAPRDRSALHRPDRPIDVAVTEIASTVQTDIHTCPV
jgi:hypothetical protein